MTEHIISAHLPTKYGDFNIHGYVDDKTGEHNIALVQGDITDGQPVLVRVHSECLTGDTFGSEKCDCGDQLDAAMKAIGKRGRGVLIYLRQEGRGIGLINKIKAYSLQDHGMDTVEANLALGLPADSRNYTVAAEILADLGISKIHLLTNNLLKIEGLEQAGIVIVKRIPIETQHKHSSDYYMQTKKNKMGHILNTY